MASHTTNDEGGRRLLTDRIRARGTQLLGRDEEIQSLQELVENLTKSTPTITSRKSPRISEDEQDDGGCQLALIHGPLGCGKMSACKALQKKFEDGPHHFLSGRFEKDHNNNPSPSTVAVQALEHLLSDQEKRSGKVISEDSALYKRLEQSLQGEARILCHLVPSFRRFLKNDTTTHKTNKNEDHQDAGTSSNRNLLRKGSNLRGSMMKAFTQRLSVACVAFLKSFCTPDYPVVIVIEDVQFADVNSLAIAVAICQSKEINNCLFIAAYRDDEPDIFSPASLNMLNALKEQPNCLDLQFGNLSSDQTQTLVFDLLSIEKDRANQDAIALAKLIHHNTVGNPYYVIQFLLSMHQKRLLRFHFASMKWVWDWDKIQEVADVADNVAAILTSRLSDLSPPMLCFLQLASCLGYSFDVVLLERLVEKIHLWFPDTRGLESSLPFDELMQQAQEEHLLSPSGHFSHDKVHASLYDMVGPIHKELHWKIGNFTRELMEDNEQDRGRLLFLATNQLIKGSSCLTTEKDRIDLIQLNCEASDVAQERNFVHLVGFFSRQARALICDSDWDKHYPLLIKIFNSLATYESSRGDYDQAILCVNTILEKAKDPQDTVVALVSRIRIHLSVLDLPRVLMDARQALSICSERLPPSNLLMPKYELLRAKRLLNTKSDEELLGLPRMTDFMKKQSILILLMTQTCAWMTLDIALFSTCAARMIFIVLKNGQYRLGPVLAGFAAAAADLRYNLLDNAIRFAELALRTSETHKIRPSLTLFAYNFVLHARLPIASIVEPALAGYRSGLELGDTFFGATCLIIYSNAYLGSGLPLHTYSADMQKYVRQLNLLGSDLVLSVLLPSMQLARNLSGQTEDPSTINWEVLLNLGYFSSNARPQDNIRSQRKLMYSQLCNSFVLRDVQRAEATAAGLLRLTASKQAQTELVSSNNFNDYFFLFLESLSAFWLYLEVESKKMVKLKYLRMAKRSLRWLVERKNINTVPMIALLEALKTSTQPFADASKVTELFDSAIVMFSRSGQTQFAAFSNELAGEYLLRQADTAAAQFYLARCVELYRDWAAVVKVKQLVQNYDFLSTKFDENGKDIRIRGKTLRGRQRYRESVDAATSTSSSMANTIMASGQTQNSSDNDITTQGSSRTQGAPRVKGANSVNEAPATNNNSKGFSRLRWRRVVSS